MNSPTSPHTLLPLAPVSHVGLMLDTFIANTNVEDLRAVVRALLVTGPPNTASAFQNVARQRLKRHCLKASLLPPPSALYTCSSTILIDSPYSSASSSSSSMSLPSVSSSTDSSSDPTFAPQTEELIKRARALFGAGLGLESLPILSLLIRGTHNLQWSEDGPFVDALAILDSDISQAIQSSFEQISCSCLSSSSSPPSSPTTTTTTTFDQVAAEEGRRAAFELHNALTESQRIVESWGGEFPFERGLDNLESLQQNDVWVKAVGLYRFNFEFEFLNSIDARVGKGREGAGRS